ncbi:MAG: hypothetical protein QM754_00735 [Tepidisphaeraceae bacterium]
MNAAQKHSSADVQPHASPTTPATAWRIAAAVPQSVPFGRRRKTGALAI